MLILGLGQLLDWLHGGPPQSIYYLFPVQTVVCAGVLALRCVHKRGDSV